MDSILPGCTAVTISLLWSWVFQRHPTDNRSFKSMVQSIAADQMEMVRPPPPDGPSEWSLAGGTW
jgi:hypothetical protein